jgi:hypothetical protein
MIIKRSFLCSGGVFVLGALALAVFASCTTFLPPDYVHQFDPTITSSIPGALTITNIPAEFEGKFVSIPPVYSLVNGSGSASISNWDKIQFGFGNRDVLLSNYDYRGKLVSFPVYSLISALRKEEARKEGIAIKNGEVTLLLYLWERYDLNTGTNKCTDKIHGYAGSDIRDVKLNIRDKADILPKNLNALNELARVDGIMKSVKFVNGVAMVEWDDVVR